MTLPMLLKDRDGNEIDGPLEGTTAFVVMTLDQAKPGEPALTKVKVKTLKATLTRMYAPFTIINGRNGQDVKDTNGGSLEDSGQFTLELAEEDNVLVDTILEDDEYESHRLLIKWTYDYVDPVTAAVSEQTGSKEYEIRVRPLPTPVAP